MFFPSSLFSAVSLFCKSSPLVASLLPSAVFSSCRFSLFAVSSPFTALSPVVSLTSVVLLSSTVSCWLSLSPSARAITAEPCSALPSTLPSGGVLASSSTLPSVLPSGGVSGVLSSAASVSGCSGGRVASSFTTFSRLAIFLNTIPDTLTGSLVKLTVRVPSWALWAVH